MKTKIRECPFCGKVPSGKRFCGTDRGPALECDDCSAMGPPALEKELIGPDEKRHEKLAIEKWNRRSFDRDSYRIGIEAAASFVEMFDKYVSHPYLLSDCILGKFNLIGKRAIRKNGSFLVKVFSAASQYSKVCFEGGDRVSASNKLWKEMKALCKQIDRRTPVRRKGERRLPGGPEFMLGSLLSSERRGHTRRAGVGRRVK